MTKLTNDNVRTLPAGPKGDAIYADDDSKHGVPGLYLRVRKRLRSWSKSPRDRVRDAAGPVDFASAGSR